MQYLNFLKFIIPLIFLQLPLALADEGVSQEDPDNQILDIQSEKTVRFDLLNKLSGKKCPIEISLGSSLVIHDIRIEPHACIQEKDSFHGMTYRVPLTIYLEQDMADDDQDEPEDPIELFSGDLTTNPCRNQHPIEHAIYDLILKSCD